jgi:putative acetyltransferase
MGLSIRLLDPAARAEFRAALTGLAIEAAAEGLAVDLDTPAGALFGAFDDGRLVGAAILEFDARDGERHRARLSALIVGRADRRLGAGRALATNAIAHATAKGRDAILFETPAGGAGEILARHLGFRVTGFLPDGLRDASGESIALALLHLDQREAELPDLTPYRLRAARDADSTGIVDHIAAIWAEYPGCVMDLAEESDLVNVATGYAQDGGAIWVAETADGKLAATVAISPCEEAPGGIKLGRLYVAKSARRGGLASKLLDFAERVARARGALFMELWSDTRFVEAHRFYEVRGYTRLPGERALRDASDSYEFHFRKRLG